MAIHMAHPSVRMKGTEIDWSPIHCMDGACAHTIKGLHLHCPFCTQDSPFTDQLILKAHYRVKHVDKAIDFAGLKILRCCRSCEVHGIIHDRKHFKVPHWHCYHCHNGFNRRDEAIKHYQQHFRYPQTTIQIVIAQDVNQTYTSTAPSSTSLVTHLIVPQSHQPIHTDTIPGNEQNGGQQIQYQYECNNDLNQSAENGEETVVLIEIPDDASKEDFEATNCYTEQNGINLTLLIQEKEQLEKTLLEERAKWARTEQKITGTIERLRAKVEYLSNTNTSLKQQLIMMHTSSLKRLTNDDSNQSILDELVQHMSEEHTQLLHHHLAQLRLYAEACQLSEPVQEGTSPRQDQIVQDLGDQSQNISEITMMSSSESGLENIEQTVVMTITSEDSQSFEKIEESQVHSTEQDTLSLEKDAQMSSNDNNVSYQLSSGLSPKSNTSESGQVYESDCSHSPHDGVCDITQQDFDKDKSLKLILSDGCKIFCGDGLEKRTYEDDISNEGPPLKRGRASLHATCS